MAAPRNVSPGGSCSDIRESNSARTVSSVANRWEAASRTAGWSSTGDTVDTNVSVLNTSAVRPHRHVPKHREKQPRHRAQPEEPHAHPQPMGMRDGDRRRLVRSSPHAPSFGIRYPGGAATITPPLSNASRSHTPRSPSLGWSLGALTAHHLAGPLRKFRRRAVNHHWRNVPIVAPPSPSAGEPVGEGAGG